jgi:hypothetical protein
MTQASDTQVGDKAVDGELKRLRDTLGWLGLGADLDPASAAVAQGDSEQAIADLTRIDAELATYPATGPASQIALRARGIILVLSEVLTEHAATFDAGAPR